MDLDEFDKTSINHKSLDLSIARWSRLMALLVNEGYITGVDAWNVMNCDYLRVAMTRPEITLKGLEYLVENSFMKKAANLARGIAEIIP